MLRNTLRLIKHPPRHLYYNAKRFATEMPKNTEAPKNDSSGANFSYGNTQGNSINYSAFQKKPKVLEATDPEKVDLNTMQMLKLGFKLFGRKPVAADLFAEVEQYAFSKEFDKEKLSWNARRYRKSLAKVLEDYTKEMVYSFQEYFDRDVYSELERIKRTQFFALDDYFIYNYKKKPLEQIISEDVLQGQLDEDSAEVIHLEKYINDHIAYLDSLTIEDIIKNHIYWGLKTN